ncbi:MAG: HAMP domain-containing sensor histidine kinase [Fulvivirga sp.]|uniref:sensor histidine kinase n=2 Tax=Fulvivirga sp. TaxID=1931237 RepID=UPI0032EB6EA2
MNLSFRNRIAFYYMMATAIIMAVVFGAIFFTVKETVWQNLDNDLSYEAKKHTGEIQLIGDSILFMNKAEWEEREHREIQVNPVFIQLIDKQGKLMDKSPNLKLDQLPFKASEFGGHFDTKLNDRAIRQAQMPIERNGKIKGYILAAMSSESAFSIILKLRNVLLISYFIVLIGLYFVSRFLAGRSIIPVQGITNTITRITKNNLKERVSLPQNQDEIYDLSSSFNALLQRIEKAMERERQFTSDASHELRTPLAALRGTLEVLIRKPRTQQEYEEKINYSLKEIERMTEILEQLLLLARLETSPGENGAVTSPLSELIDESISHFKTQIDYKKLKVNVEFDQTEKALVPHYYSNIIIDNVISNAIKYSNQNGKISIVTGMYDNQIICTIKDEGIGIKEADLAHIYDSFYRSDALSHKHITGNGLGLSIAKKCADAIHAQLTIESTYGEGTKVTVAFLS